MSYDLTFDCGPLPEAHHIQGGTHALGGTTEPWLNITWNYGPFYRKIWPEEGIRALYGKTAAEVMIELARVIPTMALNSTENYWDATEGNARRALENLMALAMKVPPDSVLNGD